MSDRAFRRESLAVNLRRIPWLLGAAMILSGGAIAILWPSPAMLWLRLLLAIDLASAGVLLLLNGRIRRLPENSPWPSVYVWFIAILALAYMDGYYFVGGAAFGQSPAYILGTITAGALFLLPPRGFLWLLIGNHFLFCFLLLTLSRPGMPLLPILLENTTGATVAGLVSLLLYRARREEFFQRQTLSTVNQALEKKNRQLNDLMAITAHDLRSPLLGLRDLLSLAGQAPPGGAGEILGHASRGCSDLLSLVNRLLDAYAAEEQAENSLPLSLVDVRQTAAIAAEDARLRAASRRISVHEEVPAEPVLLRANEAALRQVFDNLLSNAVKFSPIGGVVTARLLQEAGRWHWEVRDSGPGIAEEDRGALFQKFRKGANLPASGEPGSGLGLFIAATFMRAMGGNVEYIPSASPGATFRVTFGPA